MKIKLAVIFGGKSVEHEISVISALQAAAALDTEKYDVLPLYITKDNAFYIGEDVGKIEAYKDIPALLRHSQQVLPARLDGKAVLLRTPAKKFGSNVVATIECALPIVHGTNVEDGTLQGLLRLLGVPFAGCDVAASAIGMDKFAQKCVFKYAGIPVLDCVQLGAAAYDEDPDAAIENIAAKFGFPVIVKPVNLGSSVGIGKANDKAALQKALELAFQFAGRVLVEPAVQNLREINCAVLGNADAARASVCEEPLNADEILSYENKYMRGGKSAKSGKLAAQPAKAACTAPKANSPAAGGAGGAGGVGGGMASLERKIPAELPEGLSEKIQGLAVQAFQSIDCNGVARIDFLMDGTTGEVWLNEINTIPGSLSFYLWEPAGVPYTQLLDEMIRLAFARQRANEDLHFSFETNVLESAQFGGSKK